MLLKITLWSHLDFVVFQFKVYSGRGSNMSSGCRSSGVAEESDVITSTGFSLFVSSRQNNVTLKKLESVISGLDALKPTR